MLSRSLAPFAWPQCRAGSLPWRWLWVALALVMLFRALAPGLSHLVLQPSSLRAFDGVEASEARQGDRRVDLAPAAAQALSAAARSGQLQLLALCSVSGMRWVVDPALLGGAQAFEASGQSDPASPDAGLLIADHGCLLCAASVWLGDSHDRHPRVVPIAGAAVLRIADQAQVWTAPARRQTDPPPRAPPSA